MKPWWMAPAWVARERCRGPSVAERRTGSVHGGGGTVAERRMGRRRGCGEEDGAVHGRAVAELAPISLLLRARAAG
jgi:hypothetical protein